MSKRWIAVALIGAFLLSVPGLFSGYTQSAGSALDRIEAAGVVRIGTRFENPPASFIDDAGEWVGFDVDLGDEIARRLGVEVERVRVDGTTRITFLAQGRIDLAVASMNHTRRRDDPIDFSVTYFWDGQSLMGLKDRGFERVEDISIMAAVEGSSAIPNIRRYFEERGLPLPEIKQFRNQAEALNAVRNGQADAFGQDSTLLFGIAAGDPDFVIIGAPFADVFYGVGVPENDSEFRDAINFALHDLWSDGTYMALFETWFVGEDAAAGFEFPLLGEMEVWEK